jgi:signal transduction histidine kinase
MTNKRSGVITLNDTGSSVKSPEQDNPGDRDRTIRLLIVEDDHFYFRYVEQLLKHSSRPKFEVFRAESLAQACDFLRWNLPDLIVVDLLLSDSSGLSTLTAIKETAGMTPLVVLTVSDDSETGLMSVAGGAQDYLVKQRIGKDSLVRCLRYAIERHKAEEARLRLAAIKNFMATLAHDLSVPFIGGKNILDALISGALGDLTAEQISVLSELRHSNSELLALIRKLLEIYSYEITETLAMAPVKIDQLLSACVDKAASEDLRLDAAPDLPEVMGDHQALERLFDNLIANSLKFKTEGTPVRISTQVLDGKVAVHVHNLGKVIPPEVRACLFQSFWQGLPGKQYVANSGTGLFLCHRIAALHRGTIFCTSTAEEGTTFTVAVPMMSRLES